MTEQDIGYFEKQEILKKNSFDNVACDGTCRRETFREGFDQIVLGFNRISQKRALILHEPI